MNSSLIDQLKKEGYLKTPDLIKAFEKIKRKDFLLNDSQEEAEINAPIDIGAGQTISQPLTVVFMLELLEPKAGQKILDIGAGSGWTTALLAEVMGERGRVYAIERISSLEKFARKNVDKYNFVKEGRVKFFCQDGTRGLPEYAPFDRILVSAAARVIPEILIEELKIGGRLVIPVGSQFLQDIVLIEKVKEGKYLEKRFPGFVFVPLIQN